MGLKKLLIPLFVLLIVSQAFAAAIDVDVTVNQPNGQTFFPVTQNQRFMDINFTVVDDNSENPIHTAIIQFDRGDVNVVIAQDRHLDSGECNFHVANVWTTPGADCIIRYTFPRTGTTIPTGTYVLDVNVVSVGLTGDNNSEATGINTFSINNRLVSTNVMAILTLSTLILAAIFIISIALFLGNVIDGNMMVLIAIAGIGAVLGIILVSEFLLILTP